MLVEKFSNILLSTLVVLQLVGFFLVFGLWDRFGMRGAVMGAIISFITNIIVLFYLQKTNIYDEDGNVKSIGDMFGDVTSIVVWLVITTLVLILVGLFMSVHLAHKHGRSTTTAMLIPFLSIGTFFASIFVLTKVCKKIVK